MNEKEFFSYLLAFSFTIQVVACYVYYIMVYRPTKLTGTRLVLIALILMAIRRIVGILGEDKFHDYTIILNGFLPLAISILFVLAGLRLGKQVLFLKGVNINDHIIRVAGGSENGKAEERKSSFSETEKTSTIV